jgi:hypothetical protein
VRYGYNDKKELVSASYASGEVLRCCAWSTTTAW